MLLKLVPECPRGRGRWWLLCSFLIAALISLPEAIAAPGRPRILRLNAGNIHQFIVLDSRRGFTCRVRRPFTRHNTLGKLTPARVETGAKFVPIEVNTRSRKRLKQICEELRRPTINEGSPTPTVPSPASTSTPTPGQPPLPPPTLSPVATPTANAPETESPTPRASPTATSTATATATTTSTPTPLPPPPPEAMQIRGTAPRSLTADGRLFFEVEFLNSNGNRTAYRDVIEASLVVQSSSGTIVRSQRLRALEGLVRFSVEAPRQVGSYNISITSPLIESELSHALSVTAAEVHTLQLASEIPRQIDIHVDFNVEVEARDRYLNPCPGVALSLTLLSGNGTLRGPTQAVATNGLAEFTGLRYISGNDAQLVISDATGRASLELPLQAIRSSERKGLAWSRENTEGLDNILPWYTVREWTSTDYPYACSMPQFVREIKERARLAKEHTDRMPTGFKSIMLFWELTPLWDDPRDFVKDSQGQVQGWSDEAGTFHPYLSPWWDNAARESRCRIERFINEFHRLGGQVDYLVLDTERTMTNWQLDNFARDRYGADRHVVGEALAEQRRLRYYQAIENDPRMDRIDSGEFGFTQTTSLRTQLSEGSLTAHVANWFPVRAGPHRNAYLQWNELMGRRAAIYKRYAVEAPIAALYPQIKMSEYESTYSHPSHNLPDAYGHRASLFADEGRVLVGNRQATPMYGFLPDMAYYYVRDPWLRYLGTGFNAVRADLNVLRSGTIARPDVPFQPWIAYKSFGSQPNVDACGNCRYDDNDYYFELLYHALLSTTEPILFWNPAGLATRSDMQLFSEALRTYDSTMGYSVNRQSQISDLIGWEDDYILTSQESDYATVYRFTPDIAPEIPLENSIISTSPALLRTPSGQILTFPGGGEVVRDSLSNRGVWVVVHR